MNVRHIDFETLKNYWIETDHFDQPGKKIREVVRNLGPYQCAIADPRRISYGLFDGEMLVGATHLVEWNEELVRYRTLNVRPVYRGNDRGYELLSKAIALDWQDDAIRARKLMGWIRRDHAPWAQSHGFGPLDGTWHDDHIAMTRPLRDFLD